MQTKPASSVWFTASAMGCIYGILISIHAWLGLFTNIELNDWLVLNNILFISLLISLAVMGFLFRRRGVSLHTLTGAVILCAIIWGILFMITYIVCTTLFVDQAVQIAFFKRDYVYHGYKSVAEALSVNNNAVELIKLQVFSLAISLIFQWGSLIFGVTLSKIKSSKRLLEA